MQNRLLSTHTQPPLSYEETTSPPRSTGTPRKRVIVTKIKKPVESPPLSTSFRSISETDIFEMLPHQFPLPPRPSGLRESTIPEDANFTMSKENIVPGLGNFAMSKQNLVPGLGNFAMSKENNPVTPNFTKSFANMGLDSVSIKPLSQSSGNIPRILRVDSAPPTTGKAMSSEITRLLAEANLIRAKISPRKMHLDILTKTSQPELNCISPETVASLVTGAFDSQYDQILIIDCRFEYEFKGGHIRGALNLPREEDLELFLIKDTKFHLFGEKLCLVFYCEFSSHRGPKAYKKIRSLDRKQNEYPNLFYPEMYLLEGGYKKFWEQHPDICEPCGYVEMKDPTFVPEMRLGMATRGRSKSQRRFFSQSCSNIFDELNKSQTNPKNLESTQEEAALFRTNSSHT